MVSTSAEIVNIDPQVVHTQLQSGEAVLLHLVTRRYYSLNQTGAWIWRHLSEGMPLSEIAQTLAAEFTLSSDHALRCVTDFTAELAGEELVSFADAG